MFGISGQVIIEMIKNKKFWMIIFLTLIFIYAAFYVYNTYVVPRINAAYVPNREFVNKEEEENGGGGGGGKDGKAVDLYFFYTTWCPHCKSARPIWEELKANTQKVNGYKIIYNEVDCEEEPELAQKFKVEGYPTIKLSVNKKIIEYDAKPDLEILNQFLNQSLNQ